MNWTLQNADGQQISYAAGAVPTVYAPTNAPYVTVTPDANLSAEFALSTLAAGLLYNNPGGNPSIATLAQIAPQFAVLSDIQAAGTAGGTFTSGAWQKRAMATVYNPNSLIVSNISNEFALVAGTYLINAWAIGNACGQHKIRLYNVTDAAVQASAYGNNVVGSSAGGASNPNTDSQMQQMFTIAAQKTMRLEHRCTTTRATDGFGVATNVGEYELYAHIVLTRVA